MADGLNKVTLIGNLGADPEMRATNSGKEVTNFTLATGESWKDDSGQKQSSAEWHRIVIWGKTAKLIKDYLHKGSKVYLEGKIKTRKWTNKDGNDQYTTEVVANKVLFLDPKPQGQGQGQGNNNGGNYNNNGGYGNNSNHGGNPPVSDDDIPF